MVIRKAGDIPVVGPGDHYMTTTQVGASVGVSSQGIIKAIKTDRLNATWFNEQFFILKSDAKKFAKKTGRKFIAR